MRIDNFLSPTQGPCLYTALLKLACVGDVWSRYLFSFKAIIHIIWLLFINFGNYTHFLKSRNCNSGSIRCRSQPIWKEQKQHIITCCHPLWMCPVPWRMRLMLALQHGGLNLFHIYSANNRAWLDHFDIIFIMSSLTWKRSNKNNNEIIQIMQIITFSASVFVLKTIFWKM